MKDSFSLGQLIIKILTSMLILAIASFLTPYFSISGGLAPLFTAAIVIGILDYLLEKLVGLDASPFGRGFTGFASAALVIYLTGLMVGGVAVNFIGALLAALVIGFVNALIPGKLF